MTVTGRLFHKQVSLLWQMLFCQFIHNRSEQSRTEQNRTEQKHEATCLVRSSYLRKRAFPFFCCPLALLFTQSSSEAMLRCKLSCCLFSVCTTHLMPLLFLAASILPAFGLHWMIALTDCIGMIALKPLETCTAFPCRCTEIGGGCRPARELIMH